MLMLSFGCVTDAAATATVFFPVHLVFFTINILHLVFFVGKVLHLVCFLDDVLNLIF